MLFRPVTVGSKDQLAVGWLPLADNLKYTQSCRPFCRQKDIRVMIEEEDQVSHPSTLHFTHPIVHSLHSSAESDSPVDALPPSNAIQNSQEMSPGWS
jgi:hypothetical protein